MLPQLNVRLFLALWQHRVMELFDYHKNDSTPATQRIKQNMNLKALLFSDDRSWELRSTLDPRLRIRMNASPS